MRSRQPTTDRARQRPAPTVPPLSNSPPRSAGRIRARAYLIGLAGTLLVDLWIHYAELVLGGTQGHSALANTSIPLGAFCALFVVVIANRLLRRVGPGWALAPVEVLVVYVMMTVATVLSSSGMIHFIVPTVAAPIYFGLSGSFQSYLRPWLAQTDAAALRGFYRGNEPIPVAAWLPQMAAWCGFLVLLTLTTFCLVALVRRQWIERERLTFPTVFLPLELIRNDEAFLADRLLWCGAALPFVVGVFNNLNLNLPSIPGFDVRTQDLSPYFPDPPWNAIGYTPLSFYPFVIGIAYLLSLEVVFSAWLFLLVTRFELVAGAVWGLREGATGGARAVFPYLGHQGAGAFLAIAALSLWLARRELASVFRSVVSRRWVGRDDSPPASLETQRAAEDAQRKSGSVREFTRIEANEQEPPPNSIRVLFARIRGSNSVPTLRPSAALRASSEAGDESFQREATDRWAVWGFAFGLVGLMAFAMAGGMRFWVALLFYGVALAYWLAATRIRAESGNAWLFGPEVDANRLLTTVPGTAFYLPGDLMMMAFLRSVSSFDLRCIPMPHALDGFKMADGVDLSPRRLVLPIVVATVIGAVATFWIGLAIWYRFGALAKTDSWRTLQGRVPFELLAGQLSNPVQPDMPGTLAVVAGFAITLLLSLLRTRLTGWPLHPVGYALANTPTMASVWVPFLIAWACKAVVLRYGGMRLYRRSLPFFLGLILGDFLNGGFWTLLGCFAPINVYPINW